MKQEAVWGCSSERQETLYIQGDSGGKVNILGDNSTGHCEKSVRISMYLILMVTQMKLFESTNKHGWQYTCQRNIWVRFCNHYCSGSITYCLCSLSYPACNGHTPYCHLWPATLYNIFGGKKILNTKYDFDFLYNLFF